jgi:hypothetical protein
MLKIADFPQLKFITWNRRDDDVVSEKDALSLYERNWRFVEQAELEPHEQALIDRLVRDYGNGVLNVSDWQERSIQC